MKATTRKNACMVALAIAASANAPAGLADIYFGPSVRLEPQNTSTDVYGLTCPIGTAVVRAQVGNLLGGVAQFISVQLINPNGDASSANAPQGLPSPTVSLVGAGAGNYLVSVHKSLSAVVEPYDINMDCHTANGGAFAGTQSALVQNH